MQTAVGTSDAYKNFISSLDSEASRRTYRQAFPHFMRFCKIDSYEEMLNIQPAKKLEGIIRDYIIYLREDRKVSPSTIMSYTSCIAHFYEMNDVAINWKKLKKFKGRYRSVVEDIPYSRDQIKTLLDRASLRERCMILLMASSGVRRGALTNLRIKDLTPVPKYNLYKITVYKREQEQYVTYCTPECAKLLDQYLQWRSRLGEQLQPETILFRAEFDTTSHMFIAKPKPLRADSISHIINELLDRTGIRPHTQGNTKSSLMTCHGFRKFFDTQCINHNMNPLYTEYLMGHKTGLIKSYFKPSDNELLEGNDKTLGYTAIIPYLTINATEEENNKLKQQVAELKEYHSKEWELMRQQVSEIKKKMGIT